MIIELRHLLQLPVVDTTGRPLGELDQLIVNNEKQLVAGLLVRIRSFGRNKVLPLGWDDLTALSRQAITVKPQKPTTAEELREFKKAHKIYGRIIGLPAKTESGKRLGRLFDCYIETTTGQIIRYHIKDIFKEQIIPIKYLIAMTPQQIVFHDVVATSRFDSLAAAENPA